MRPNSLFFDRGGRQSFARNLSMIITIAFLALIGYIVIRYKSFAFVFRNELFTTPMLGWLFLGYALFVVAFTFIIRWANCRVHRIPLLWALAVFLLALAPRVLVNLVAASAGGAITSADVSAFFAQPAFYTSVILSLSAMLVYLIARRFDEGSAPAAGLLFALYPANIFFSQNWAFIYLDVLLVLFSVLLLLIAFSSLRQWSIALLAAFSGALLALGSVQLVSLRILAIAYGLFWLVLFLSSLRQKREILRLVTIALAFSIVFFGLHASGLAAKGRSQMDNMIGFSTQNASMQQDANTKSEWSAFRLESLRDGLLANDKPASFDQTVMHLWMEKDESIALPSAGSAAQNNMLTPLLQGIRLLDFLFVAGILLFSWFGALLRRRGGAGDLLLWVFFTWAVAHFFSEQQFITRALSMPFLVILAAYGYFAIVGAQPGAKHAPQRATCVNLGALALGEIPPQEPRPGGSGGLYDEMERSLAAQQEER